MVCFWGLSFLLFYILEKMARGLFLGFGINGFGLGAVAVASQTQNVLIAGFAP